jgi:hypothetical protein
MLGVINIASLYLAQPPDEVATRINDYIRSHAPASYLESVDEPDDELEPPINAD